MPYLMLKEAASRDAGVGIRKDALRREGHSEDIAAPEAAPAEHRQAVVSGLHLTGRWTPLIWAALMYAAPSGLQETALIQQ